MIRHIKYRKIYIYYLTINYGDTSGCLMNCISNTPYIKLMGTYVTGLTLDNAIVYMKG